jgi:hypothetical protein
MLEQTKTSKLTFYHNYNHNSSNDTLDRTVKKAKDKYFISLIIVIQVSTVLIERLKT